MIFRQLVDRETCTYTYLLGDPESRQAVIIDPVLEQVDRDLAVVGEIGLELILILDTHVHADHVTGAGALADRTGAQTALGATANVDCADRSLRDGERLGFGAYEIEARHTPGHTSGCTTYVVDAGSRAMAFTGDTLMIRGCGRTDFQGGDAHTLFASVHGRIFTLPDDTLIYPGHDYRGHTSSTVEEERAHNPRLGAQVTEERFVRIMGELGLAYPKRMDVAVPANMACGRVR